MEEKHKMRFAAATLKGGPVKMDGGQIIDLD
jgi:hypothetical protein